MASQGVSSHERQRALSHHLRRQPRRAAHRAVPRTTSTRRSTRSSTTSSANAHVPARGDRRSSACATRSFAKQWFEEHEEELRGGWDAIKRDQELDGDGVAAEVIFPDADAVESRTCVPFGAGLGLSGDLDPELGHGRREGPQPVAGRAVRRTARSVAAASPWCRSPRRLDDGAGRDPPGQGVAVSAR